MPGRFPPPPEAPPGYGPRHGAPSPGASIYPLDFGRVFELTFSLFRFNWKAFLAAALVIMIPVAALNAAMQYVAGTAMSDWMAEFITLSPDDLGLVLASYPWRLFALGIAVSVVTGIGTYLVVAATAWLTAATITGARASGLEATRAALARLRSIIGAYLLIFGAIVAIGVIGGLLVVLVILGLSGSGGPASGLAVFIGLVVGVATFAAVILVGVRWAFVAQSIVFEGAGAVGSLGRSWRLVVGSTWRVLGYTILFGILVALIATIVGTVMSIVVYPQMFTLAGSISLAFDNGRLALIAFLNLVLTALLTPIPTIALTLLWFDLRWHHGQPVPMPGQAGGPST